MITKEDILHYIKSSSLLIEEEDNSDIDNIQSQAKEILVWKINEKALTIEGTLNGSVQEDYSVKNGHFRWWKKDGKKAEDDYKKKQASIDQQKYDRDAKLSKNLYKTVGTVALAALTGGVAGELAAQTGNLARKYILGNDIKEYDPADPRTWNLDNDILKEFETKKDFEDHALENGVDQSGLNKYYEVLKKAKANNTNNNQNNVQ